MSSKEILNDIINDFEPQKFIKFFREKSRKFKPLDQSLSNYNNEDFSDGNILGEISLEDSTEFIICNFKVIKPLSERSGKKAQYILGKKILKETARYVGGIFIFYDDKGDFRFSLIYDIPLTNGKRDWSNFRRYTYYVSKGQTNKTFLHQITEVYFSSLDKIIEAFSIEKVTKDFYTEIANWYFWALDEVEFPDDVDKKREERNAKNLIRLITRIIFVWFMKEKKLVSPSLFDKQFIEKILNFNDKTGSTYYKAILQNLFFASLNTQMKKENNNSRMFIEDAKNIGFINEGYLQQGFYRYSRFVKDKKLFLEHFGNIPFLNGGLFECLDKKNNEKEIRIDCFSDNPKNETRLKVPDKLFFLAEEIDVDLSKHLASWKNRKVRGLFSILKSYNFTIDENTPVDEEVALDPELLGKVFENLLASYIPATSTTARKSTGSYYTPRVIVEYMVNESLIEYLKTKLVIIDTPIAEKIRLLFEYNSDENPFINEPEFIDNIISAIENIKILDPACGSGAFPMGILHKLVLALHKLDPDNNIWKKRLLDRVPAEIRDETEKSLQNKSLDYIRKLGLIEHCIYGVDIQEIAIQISKLRFFISLLVEQEIDESKPNRDVRSLPNLETKFVAANTLIGLDKPSQLIMMGTEIEVLESKLFKLREEIFYTNSRWEKIKFQENEKQLRDKLKVTLSQSGFGSKTAQQIANWDPFDQNTHAEWFDAEWMFGPNVKDGFDIVIGNPPYGFRTVLTKEEKEYFRNIRGIAFSSGDSAELFCKICFDKVVKSNGILTFIIPKKSLYGDAWEDMRTAYWKKFDLAFILDTGKSFDNVLLEASVFGLVKSSNNRKVELAFLESNLSIQKFSNTEKEYFFLENNTCQIYKVLYPKSLFDKIIDKSHRSKKIKTKLGLAIGQDFFSDSKTNYKLLKGIDITKYIIRSHRYLKNHSKLKWENVEVFLKPKLISQVIVAHIENPYSHLKITACYDAEGIAITNTLMAFETDSDIDLRFLLSYLNTKFVSWYAYNFIYSQAIRTMHFYDFYIQQLPVPKIELKQQKPFITLVNKILAAKGQDPEAATKHIENQIDIMVYKLYNLTYEEVEIIDPQIGNIITKIDYDKYQIQ